jgi:hypothetical protein
MTFISLATNFTNSRRQGKVFSIKEAVASHPRHPQRNVGSCSNASFLFNRSVVEN